MITTCDCDKAFDLLTRGDSLNREDAGRLDQHLAAYAFLSNLGGIPSPLPMRLFHEVLTQDRSNLPVYSGNPQLNWSTVIRRRQRQVTSVLIAWSNRRGSLRPFALAITLSLLAVCVGGGFAGSLPMPRNDEATSNVLLNHRRYRLRAIQLADIATCRHRRTSPAALVAIILIHH
ncbi:MAG: hypothetical protein R3C28_19320 [Pirellulaceae bacterium]